MHEKTIKENPKGKNPRSIRDRPIHSEWILQSQQTNELKQSNRKTEQNAEEDKGRSIAQSIN
jgi:hypothetical protein